MDINDQEAFIFSATKDQILVYEALSPQVLDAFAYMCLYEKEYNKLVPLSNAQRLEVALAREALKGSYRELYRLEALRSKLSTLCSPLSCKRLCVLAQCAIPISKVRHLLK